ncbi:MAG: hypothetical protein ACYTGW_14895 [Planctomycetota bacterium]|jgi:Zn ribbon nucleic-acid-binding protein
MKPDFEHEKKWCPKCGAYRHYLMSVNHSFCVECGTQMRLFNKKDQQRFTEELQKRRLRTTAS